MRVDNIDLIGEFKIQGLTGSSSQALGLSGGSLNWIEVSGGGGGGGSNDGLIKNSGYNYILVHATGDAISNGNKLIQAYADAITLSGNIGTPGVSNRISILLTPGIYDLDTQYVDLTTSFIDIIGMSTNPLDTKIKAYGSSKIFNIGSSIDMALENVWLDSNTELFIYDGGSGTGNFLRWKNLILRGNGFYSGGFYALYDIDGYFENIKYISPDPSPGTEYFVTVTNNINGTFKNIDLGLVTNAFHSVSGQINAKFSNITNSNSIGTIFFADGSSGYGSISGRFEKIRLNMTNGNVFKIDNASVVGKLNGNFKNIHITGQVSDCFHGPVANGSSFEGITIDDATYHSGSVCFGFYGDDSYGTFKDIKIGNVYGNVFISDGLSIFGTFSNIQIGNCDNCFCASNYLDGTYEKIKIGNTSVLAFGSSYFQGTFKNITGGNFGNLFLGSDTSGSFENITFGDSANGQCFYITSDDLGGNFKNIRLGNGIADAFSGINVTGSFKNIYISQVNSSVFACQNANFEIDNLWVGSTTTFLTALDLSGTFSNINIGYITGNEIVANNNINVRLENYTSNGQNNSVFESGIGNIYGYYKNVDLKGTRGTIFLSNQTINPTLIENFKSDGAVRFLKSSGGDVDGDYRNLEVDNVTIEAFTALSGGIYGTYSNIKIRSAEGAALFTSDSNLEVNVDGLFIGTCSTAFFCNFKSSNIKINKLEMFGNFSGYVAGASKFAGLISNSTIDMRGFGDYIWYQNGILERSKILTDNGYLGLAGNYVFLSSFRESIGVIGLTFGNVIDNNVDGLS